MKNQLDRFADALKRRREQTALADARNSFEAYCMAVYPSYKAAKHHRFLIKKVEAVDRGEKPRIMTSLPPQHGKSLTISHLGVCWLLGRNPRRHIVVASYNDDRATDQGRAVLRTLASPGHLKIFPNCQVDPSAASTSRIAFLAGGAFFSTSRNGTLTGRPADIVVLDDLIKDAAEAKSPAVAREVNQFYTKVVITRLGPNGVIWLVGTRWGNLDLFNFLLTERREEGWDITNLPAFAGPNDPLGRPEGGALWVEKFPEHVLLKKRSEMGAPAFTCMYLGDPTAAEGAIFHPEHWQYYSVAPEKFKQVIVVIDPASKTAATNDFTVLQVWAETSTAFYLLHSFRARLEYTALRRTVLEFCESWHPRWVLIEDSSNGAALIQELQNTTSLPIKALKPDRSKVARAESVTPLAESGKVFLPREAAWLNDLLDEVHGFPRAAHDDQTDCLVYALMYFRDGQGALKGWFWDSVGQLSTLRKENPGAEPVELALKNGLVPGVPLHAVTLAEAQMRSQEAGMNAVRFRRNKNVFGDLETSAMANHHVKVYRPKLPDECPVCGNVALAKYDSSANCAKCGWGSRAPTPEPTPVESLPATQQSRPFHFLLEKFGL